MFGFDSSTGNTLYKSCTRGGGGVLSPFDGGGVRPETKYRGVRELLFIPKKGGLENWNKHRPKAVVGEGAGGGVPLM